MNETKVVSNVIDSGAIGDGRSKDITAFAKAIDAVSRGGRVVVVVPRGTFLTRPIVLKSDVELHAADGGRLVRRACSATDPRSQADESATREPT